MLPEATIQHRIASRVRLRIPSRRGDADYFSTVETRLRETSEWQTVAASSLTGCLVIEDEQLDVEAVRDAAETMALFSVRSKEPGRKSIARRITGPISGLNRWMKGLSDGYLDLSSLFFLLCVGFGLWELAAGNLRRPAWHTVFWYAFGLSSKTLFDECNRQDR